jgi:ATP-binding cassette, subfamily B, bacterial PglK
MFSFIPRLWVHFEKHRKKQIGALLVFTLIASLAEMISISAVIPFLAVLTNPDSVFDYQLIQPIMQSLEIHSSDQLLLPLTIIFSISVLVSGIVRISLIWMQVRLGHAIGADLSYKVFLRTIRQPYIVHTSRNSSEIISSLSLKVNHIIGSAILPTLNIISSVIILVAIISALIIANPLVSISAFFGFGFIYIIIAWYSKKILFDNSKISSEKSNQLIKVLQESLGGIRDVIINKTYDFYCSSYRKADLPLRRARANIQIVSNTPRYGVETLAMVLIALLAYIMSTNGGSGNLAIPMLGVLALGAQRTLPLLQQVYSSISQIRGGQISLNDILNLLDQPIVANLDKVKDEKLLFKKEIHLQNLCFRYSNKQKYWSLEDVNLEIKKGSKIGIIGSTGSGKSTLADVIMSLLTPQKGEMIVDGVTIDANNHSSWQSNISHVSQDIFLADATIYENIAFGIPYAEIDYERVLDAAKKAQISDFINSMEDKYKAMIGERGVRLSGGQRQRIGIARALYRCSEVIIMDEATSALDNATEKKVMEAINSIDKNTTMIIIAHRLTTLKNCDDIIELKDGKINRIVQYKDIVCEVEGKK